MDVVDHPKKPPFPPPPQPVFELKVNDNILGPKVPPQQPVYPAPYVPMVNPLSQGALHGPTMIPWNFTPNNVPVIKKYNISMNNANGDVTRIAEIFEDILPPSAIAQNRYTTLSERIVINNYMRSMLVTRGDGEEIHMDGDTKRKNFELTNLMSRLKFMDINPYHFSRLTNNVYRTLPDNMVMFRSCYPIRLQTENNMVKCADDSISAHIRIYSLSLFDKIVTAGLSDTLKKTYSDVWREILYYEKIKEDVIKRKMSPNFVIMYSYFKTHNSGVNFEKLMELKGKLANYDFDKINDVNKVKDELFYKEIVSKAHELTKGLFVVWNRGRMPIDNSTVQNNNKSKMQVITGREPDISKVRSEQCVVAITEGPTQNILNWSTKTYQVDGVIKKQIQSGIYDIKVWYSILFQLIMAMIVLEEQKLAFRDFSLENNVFIKDLGTEINNVGYWKYKLNGVDFYVPNYGYLLMIDSRFPDFNEADEKKKKYGEIHPENEHQLLHYKIYGEMYGDDFKSEGDIKAQIATDDAKRASAPAAATPGPKKVIVDVDWTAQIKENQKKIFNPDEYDNKNAFKIYGGVPPPQEFLAVLRTIHTSLGTKGLKDILIDELIPGVLNQYIHNRVGTMVNEDEKSMLMLHKKDFVKGELVAREISADSYVWSLYIGKNLDNTHKILTKRLESGSTQLEERTATDDEINRAFGTVKQTFSVSQKMAEEDLLDTYTINTA